MKIGDKALFICDVIIADMLECLFIIFKIF